MLQLLEMTYFVFLTKGKHLFSGSATDFSPKNLTHCHESKFKRQLAGRKKKN